MSSIDFPKVFCFGDSLTQRCFSNDGCWGSIIASRYQRQVDLINRGFSGYNSRQAIYLLPRLLPPYTRQLVGDTQKSSAKIPQDQKACQSIAALIVWFGANDASTAESKAHVPLEEYGANLSQIVDQALAFGVPASHIILVTPPEYDHAKWTELKIKDGLHADLICRAEGRSVLYAEKCLEIAKQRGTQLADIHRAMREFPDWRSLMIDGLHFNARGAQFVADILVKYLDPLVVNLPVMFPLACASERADPKDELTTWLPPQSN